MTSIALVESLVPGAISESARQFVGRFPALTVSIHSEAKSVQVADPRFDRVRRWAAPMSRRGCSALGGQAELGLRSGACPPDAVLARRAAHPVYASDA
jgi:hypothetical protein